MLLLLHLSQFSARALVMQLRVSLLLVLQLLHTLVLREQVVQAYLHALHQANRLQVFVHRRLRVFL